MCRFLLFIVPLIGTLSAHAALPPPYQRNPISTNTPAGVTNVITGMLADGSLTFVGTIDASNLVGTIDHARLPNTVITNNHSQPVTIANSVTATTFSNSTPKWIDVKVDGMDLRAGGTSPVRTLVEAGTGIYGTGFDSNDDADFEIQFPHGTAATNANFPNFYYTPHVHVSASTLSGGTNAAFRITWQLAAVSSTYSNTTVVTTNWLTFTNAGFHHLLSFGHQTNNLLSGVNSVVARGNLACITNDTGGRVIVDSMDFHIPVSTYGSDSQ